MGQQGSSTGDWAAQAVQLVERGVEVVRDHSVRPVAFGVRMVVLGTLIAIVAVFVVVACAIGIVRLLTVDAFSGRVWASDLVIGGIFVAGGLFLLQTSRKGGVDDA